MKNLTTYLGRVRDITALRTGAISSEQTICVGGYGSTFDVKSIEELYRLRDLRGERSVIETLLDELDYDSVYWDVGSNIGTHACICASKADKVIAFEPNDETRERLKRNAALAWGDIEIEGVALSDESGTKNFNRSNDAADGDHKISDAGNHKVSIIKGDELLNKHPAPDVIKVDVEGHELSALRGMPRALQSARFIIVEVHDTNTIESVKTLLTEAGFQNIDRTRRGEEIFIEARKV